MAERSLLTYEHKMITVHKILCCALLAAVVMPVVAQSPNPSPNVATVQETSPPKSGSVVSSEVGVCIHAENPKFPREIREKNARGEIVLDATIGTDGSVKDATVVSGEPTLTGVAIEAVRRWRYVPAIQEGHAVESHNIIRVAYDLGKGISRPEDAAPGVPMEPQEDLIQEIEQGRVFQLLCHCVTFPKNLYRAPIEYSKAAWKAKFQGDLWLGIVVGTDGKPRSIWVVRAVGRGLDEKIIESVRQWRFEPSIKDGKPVPVVLNLIIPFRMK